MTRDEYKLLWRRMTPAERRAEVMRGVGDFGGGIVLIALVALTFRFLPALTALAWACAEALGSVFQ